MPIEYLVENNEDETIAESQEATDDDQEEIITTEIAASPKDIKNEASLEVQDGSQNGYFEARLDNEAISNNPDDVYQEIYGSETQNSFSNELDPWLKGVKETLMVNY